MKLRLQPAKRGAEWARQGMRAFLRRPFSYIAIFGSVTLAFLLSRALGMPGAVLFWLATPLITLAFMLATQQVVQGGTPTLQVFALPLRQSRGRTRALWTLGALYAVAMGLTYAVVIVIAGEPLSTLGTAMEKGQTSPELMMEVGSDPRLQAGLLWLAAATAAVSVPFWHAPALVHWGGQGAAQALFSSTVACWRNKGAFLVYGLTGLAASMAVSLLVSLLFAPLGGAQLAAGAMATASLLLLMIFFASLYFTFVDCFEAPAPGDSPQEPTA